MFSVGDLIVYSETGVCRVEKVAPPEFDRRRERDYYTLTPVYGSGTIYVPVDAGVFMRPVISRAEAEELVRQIPRIRQADVDEGDHRALAQQYRGYLESHRCEDLVQLIKAVYLKNRRKSQEGKRPGKVEQDYQKRAEALLHGELAAALGIPLEEVPEYIQSRIREEEAGEGRA